MQTAAHSQWSILWEGIRDQTAHGGINCSCSRNLPQTAQLPQDPGGAAGTCLMHTQGTNPAALAAQ